MNQILLHYSVWVQANIEIKISPYKFKVIYYRDTSTVQLLLYFAVHTVLQNALGNFPPLKHEKIWENGRKKNGSFSSQLMFLLRNASVQTDQGI